jgi:hypothetical protein
LDAIEESQIARKMGIRNGDDAEAALSTSAGGAELMRSAMP